MESTSKIIIFVKADEIERSELQLPEKFVEAYGRLIPSNVRLQLPNGHQDHVHYKKQDGVLHKVGEFYKTFLRSNNLILVLTYKGNGNFLVNVFNNGYFETEYDTKARIPRAPVLGQDGDTGVGWSFLTLSIGLTFKNGGADVHGRFVKWFGKKIPVRVRISLRTGEIVPGLFSAKDRKIYGLCSIVRNGHVKHWDILLFTYRGEGLFEVSVFDKDHIERNSIKSIKDIEVDQRVQCDNNDAYEMDSDGEDNVMDDTFEIAMTPSNVNNSSHGVYLPTNITTGDGELVAGAETILRTKRGNWIVGIVNSNGKLRFSAGWNLFVRENKIKLKHSLVFKIMGEHGGKCLFEVVKKKN